MLRRLVIQILLLCFFSLIVNSQELDSSLVWDEKDLAWMGNNSPLPMEANQRIQYFIRTFQTRGKSTFTRSLAQGVRYIPLMKEIFQKMEVPEELVYLALIESGFDPHASYKTTCGPWQFTPATAKKYGLKINPWIDERKNPEKSTWAATQYLRDLYQEFGCWYLALAGFNAGEGSIKKALKRYETRDFWGFKTDGYLKKNTLNIVPKSIAAALIAKQPVKYGISLPTSNASFSYEKVTISQPVDLREIARITEVDLRNLKELNPELKKLSTPPDYPEYELKVPTGKKEIVEKNLDTLYKAKRVQ